MNADLPSAVKAISKLSVYHLTHQFICVFRCPIQLSVVSPASFSIAFGHSFAQTLCDVKNGAAAAGVAAAANSHQWLPAPDAQGYAL